MVSGEAVEDLRGAVGRAVVDDDELEVAVRLVKDAADGLLDVALGVVGGHDDGDVVVEVEGDPELGNVLDLLLVLRLVDRLVVLHALDDELLEEASRIADRSFLLQERGGVERLLLDAGLDRLLAEVPLADEGVGVGHDAVEHVPLTRLEAV